MFLYLEIFGALIGILYIILEYRASVWLWPVGIVMPFVYIYIYLKAGIYADMGINIYYLLAAIYGWIVWLRASKRHADKQSTEPTAKESSGITRTSSYEWLWCAAVLVILQVLLSYILIKYTQSTVPYCDSFTTALSIVGMWMLAHKRLEHWIVWVIVDAVSTALYIDKGLYPTAALYALYTIIATCGHFRWRRLMINDNKEVLTSS